MNLFESNLLCQYLNYCQTCCSDLWLNTLDLSSVFKPKKFPRGLAVRGQVCFEVDSEFQDDKNKFGVGQDFGEITNPYGGEWDVKWAGESDVEKMNPKYLALALQVSQEIYWKGELYCCVGYGEKGCCLKRQARKKRSRKKKQAKQPKSPQKKLKNTSRSPQKKLKAPRRTRKSVAKTSASPQKTSSSNVTRRVSPRKSAAKKTPTKTSSSNVTRRASPRKSAVKNTDEKTAKKAWVKSRAKKLTSTQEVRLSKAFLRGANEIDKTLTYQFAERTMKEYNLMQKSPIHLNSRNLLAGAIGQVMKQVRPPEDRPLKGNVSQVFDVLYPFCQNVFAFQDDTKPTNGGEGWCNHLIENDSYTYMDCYEHPMIMSHHVKKCIKEGDDKGYPVVEQRSQIPTPETVYDALGAISTYKSKNTRAHPDCPYLRQAPLDESLVHLRNNCK